MDETKVEQEFQQLLDTFFSPDKFSNQHNFQNTDTHNLELAIRFINEHEDFIKQNRRYLELNGMLVLLHPCSFPLYYELLGKMLELAKSTNDMSALTEICKCLELVYAPANVSILKNAVSTLLDCRAYQHAAELCERLEEAKRFRDTYKPQENSIL